MDSTIISALRALDVSQMTRANWIAVGMALKEEGLPVSSVAVYETPENCAVYEEKP